MILDQVLGHLHFWDSVHNQWNNLGGIPADWNGQKDLLSRDADWLVASGCELLKDCCWAEWRNELCAQGPLKSVLGFRGTKAREIAGSEAFDDNLFYGTFFQYLNSNYTGDDDHWANGLKPSQVQIDLAVRCYMEAAWNYAWTISDPTYQGPDSISLTWIMNVAAIDGAHRYVLTQNPLSARDFLISYNDTGDH